jgi:Flp pilus assembly protein TadD
MPDPAPGLRLFRRAAVPFRRAWQWFRYLPRVIQAGLALVLVGGLAGGGYYLTTVLQRRATHKEAMSGWADYDTAARKTDLPGMKAGLDRVLAAQPGNPLATRRMAALEAQAADDDDPDLARILLNHHLREERVAEAAREAEKVLARHPKDWRSICVVAHHALQVKKDPKEAKDRLGQLPDPTDPQAHVDRGGLLYALRLYQFLGEDPKPIYTLIVRRLLPILPGGTAAAAPPSAKSQLIECYLAPFADPVNLPELAAQWAAASQLADRAVSEAAEAGDVPILVRLGGLGQPMLRALALIADRERMPPDRFAALAKEINDRTRKVWEVVRRKAPTRPESYHGLAQLALRADDPVTAREVLFEGLAACGDRVELLDLLLPVARRAGDPVEAAAVAWKAAAEAKTDPAKWCLAAHALRAAGRRDLAIDACVAAREIAPNYPTACRTEALLWLETGEPREAIGRLRLLGTEAARADPMVAWLFARALVENGQFGEAGERMDAQEARGHPAAAVAFLRGVFDAAPARDTADGPVTRARWVADRADRLLGRRLDDPIARRVMADALARQSELASPPWDDGVARRALLAYDGLPSADREDLAVVATVAHLRLKAIKADAGQALRAAAPLAEPANVPLLTPVQLEVLGAVLTANGRHKEAIPALERAVRSSGATAGCWAQLALAYHADRRPREARAALGQALNVPTRSSREQFEWNAAKQLIERETP